MSASESAGLPHAAAFDVGIATVAMLAALALFVIRKRHGREASGKLWLQDALSVGTMLFLTLIALQLAFGAEVVRFDVISSNFFLILVVFAYVVVEVGGSIWESVRPLESVRPRRQGSGPSS